MRKIILGDLRRNKLLVDRIDKAWRNALVIIKQELGLVKEMDCVFFQQTVVDDSDGVLFYRYQDFIQIRLQFIDNIPNDNVIAATITQAVATAWVDRHMRNSHRIDDLLFDLFRAGVGLKLANRFGVQWHNEQLTDKMFLEQKQLIKRIVAGQADYEVDYWFDDTGKHPYFLAWFVGEIMINQICQRYQLNWQQIDHQTILDWLKF